MAYQIGQPGVSAFLESLLRDLDVVLKMGEDLFVPNNTELEEVKMLLLGFEDVLLDGEKRRQLGNKRAERWMDDLKHVFYDIDDLLHEVKIEKHQLDQEFTDRPSSSKVPYSFPASYHTSENVKYRLGQVLHILRKLTKEANRLDLKRDAVQNDATWLEYHAKFRPKQGCYADEAMIHGREREKIEIIERLLKEDGGHSKRKTKYEVICVVGMGGLGKTTLSQLVYEEVKHSFEVTSWVCVSDVVNFTKLLQDLIESASGRGDRDMPSALPALQERLENIIKDKKFLLVLDDVWTTKELKQLKGPLNSGAKGSKILVTTRMSKVAEDLDNKEPYRLGRLDDAQCLKIFNDNAFEDEDGIENDTDLMNMGKEIVRKCEGVPLVAKVIGSLLKGEDEGKWKAVKENDLWDLAYKDEDVHPGLRLSYFYLPPILKRCFEFFALFPSDFWFTPRELVQMWIAEGLIEAKEGKELEEIGHQYYNDLKGRSLIQENNMMHDMVHHLASIVCGSFFFRGSSEFSSSTSSLQNVRHAFIQEKLELLIDSRKLRTLIYKGDLRINLSPSTQYCLPDLPSSLGCDMKHLRYLKLRGNCLNSTLPDSLCALTNLQVLDLSYCWNLQNLPQDVGKLSNLRFLKLDNTGIIGLPDSLCCLSNLLVLDLSGCESLGTLPDDVGKLSNLRSLRLNGTGIIGLPDSVCCLSNLRDLDLSGYESLGTLPDDVGKLSNLCSLRLNGTGIIGLPDSVCCLSNLRDLDLSGCESLGTLPDDVGKLSNLRSLRLNGTGIIGLPDSVCCLSNLRDLDLSGCESLGTLPDDVGKLSNLRSLGLNGMGIIGLPDSVCCLSNLRDLDLSGCESLGTLPDDVGKLSNLRSLGLNGTGIIGLSDSVCCLSNLRDLDLSGCESLGTLPDDVGKLSNLRSLILNGTGIIGLPDSVCCLSNLRDLDLSGCESLGTLPDDVGKLSNLRSLRLNGTGIIGLPDSVCCLSNLRDLDLSFCISLTTLPNDIGNLLSLHKLKLLWTSISSLPESIVNATNLRVLQIDYAVTLSANIGKLTKFEELERYRVGKEKGRGIDELKGMDRLKGRLRIENMENIESREEASTANLRSKKHIEKLEFVWKTFDAALTGRDGEMEVRVMEALEPNAAIEFLSFENYVGHKFPSWMSTASLHNLTELILINLPATTEMTGMDFKSLQYLQLDNCPALREVSMTTGKLKTLKVLHCKKLKRASLVLLPLLWDDLESLECDYCHVDHFVQQLKSTNASPCTKLKKLRVWVGGDNGITSLPVVWPSIFTSLEDITLYDLPPTNFKIVSEEDRSCSVADLDMINLPAATEMTWMDFKSLQVLELDNCPALRIVSMRTPKLKRLVVRKCKELKPEKLVLPLLWDALESLECDYFHLDHFVQQLKSTNASTCTKLWNLTVWVGGDNGITSLPVGWPSIFTSVKVLILYDLPPTNFKIVSEEDESCITAQPELLVSITRLTIRDCSGLVSLESLQLPPRLHSLDIFDCPNLRNLPYGIRDLTSLQNISFQNCPVLEIRPHHPLPLSISCKLISNCPKLTEQRMMEEREEWKGAFGLIDARGSIAGNDWFFRCP